MIHTDEDDEFERIEREQKMKGQPYHWEVDAIKAAIRMEREACAKLCDEHNGWSARMIAETIRARSKQ